MEEITIRLNDFLFNSGVLGLYRILKNSEKEELITIKGNELIIKKEAFNNFEDDYIETMLDNFEKDTKWYSIVNIKEDVRKIDTSDKNQLEKLESYSKFVKKVIESASYKSGYEIVVSEKQTDNPYEYMQQYKDTKDYNTKKECIFKIIEHIEKNKYVYCMKDIIYTKINSFWENVAFLNRNCNKKNIKEEYKNGFVIPVQKYLSSTRKTDISCIECGNPITKTEASGMSWLKDVGVDINRKKSGFWNFKEDTYICPICALVYSCVPLGFMMIGSNGIFINQNDSLKSLMDVNETNEQIKEKYNDIDENFENYYQRVLYNVINKTIQIANRNINKYEPQNIQVIKRVGIADNQKYEFNIIPKDKIEILKSSMTYLEKLMKTNIYQKVLTNVIEGRKQYLLLDELFRENKNIQYIKNILMIQNICIKGGNKMNERKERIEEMIREGESLKKKFFISKESDNKLRSYIYKLQRTLNANNVEEFMKIFTMFYGGFGLPMPNCEAIKVLIEEPEYFRLLGYSYIYGLQKYSDSKKEKDNEEE